MRSTRLFVTIRAACLAAVAGLVAVPAMAVNIPEGRAVTPDSVFVIHFQVRDTCAGAPMDTLEVTVPASIQNPMPEAIDGWEAVVEPAEEGTVDSPTIVRWTGGPLEPGSFKEFGLWARFPDEPGAVLSFPAIQRCGLTEVIWDDPEGATAAPTVTLTERLVQQDLADLNASVGELVTEVDDLSSQLGDVDAPNLRSRVSTAEDSLDDIASRIDELVEQIEALQPIAQE